jgi:hypothetical protein
VVLGQPAPSEFPGRLEGVDDLHLLQLPQPMLASSEAPEKQRLELVGCEDLMLDEGSKHRAVAFVERRRKRAKLGFPLS